MGHAFAVFLALSIQKLAGIIAAANDFNVAAFIATIGVVIEG